MRQCWRDGCTNAVLGVRRHCSAHCSNLDNPLKGHSQGRSDERAAIVTWLRGLHSTEANMLGDEIDARAHLASEPGDKP